MKHRYHLITSVIMLIAFLLWTFAVCTIDVQNIGPQESKVGFAALNQWIHNLTGVHMSLYTLTDWLSLMPLSIMTGFAAWGLSQWISRKRLASVDVNILVLGVFYAIVIAVYILFEIVIINYRPVLISGNLEASYPSSTTLLVICVMMSAVIQAELRIKNHTVRKWIRIVVYGYVVFMIGGRLFSGVHWFTDIIGSILLSCGLVKLYQFLLLKNE